MMIEKKQARIQAEMCLTGYLNAAVTDYEKRLQCTNTQQGHFSASFLEPPETKYVVSNPPITASVYIFQLQSKADTTELKDYLILMCESSLLKMRF